MRNVVFWPLLVALIPTVVVAQGISPNLTPTLIQQPGPQIYPKINSHGAIAYRSGVRSQDYYSMVSMFRSSPSSGEVKLVDGMPLTSTPGPYDAVHFALSDSQVLALPLADGASGASPQSGALLSQLLFRSIGSTSYSQLNNPSYSRREGASISESILAFAWSEHRNGQWDVFVKFGSNPSLAVHRFDSGLDDRQPSMDHHLLAWTAVDQFSGWKHRNTVMVKSFADDHEAKEVANGRFPSVSYPFIAYEANESGQSAIKLYDYSTATQVEVQTCENPMRPIVTASEGLVRVYHFCPRERTLELSVPAINCAFPIGELHHRPDVTEPSQYDAKGAWVVYSYFAGADVSSEDAEFDLAVLEIENDIIYKECGS